MSARALVLAALLCGGLSALLPKVPFSIRSVIVGDTDTVRRRRLACVHVQVSRACVAVLCTSVSLAVRLLPCAPAQNSPDGVRMTGEDSITVVFTRPFLAWNATLGACLRFAMRGNLPPRTGRTLRPCAASSRL
jgi:hypothetical protein